MNSDETGIVSTTGSTACAQQPHVAHVGGQSPSSRLLPASELWQGSPTIIADTPDALTDSIATRTASRTLRTN
jgi:hypothetical protein